MKKYTTRQIQNGSVILIWRAGEKIFQLKKILFEAFPGCKNEISSFCNKLLNQNEDVEINHSEIKIKQVFFWGKGIDYSFEFEYDIRNVSCIPLTTIASIDEIACSIDINIRDSDKEKFINKYGDLV